MSIARPFNQMEGVCIPSGSGPSRPSQKTRGIARFVASVGANGFGFALISPCIANDSVCAVYSAATYSASQAAPFGLPPTEYLSAQMSGLPYTKTLFTSGDEFSTSGVHGRIVAYGVRWRYIGSELNRSGRVYSLVHPDHGNLYGASFTSLGAYKECLTTTTTREWTEQVIFSNTSQEVDYPDANNTFNSTVASQPAQEELTEIYRLSSNEFLSQSSLATYTAGTVIGGAPMAIVFDGIKGNQFEFEIVAHLEFLGTLTQSMITKSHSDPVGFGIVQEAANGLGLARQYVTGQASAMMKGLASAAGTQTGSMIKIAATQYAGSAMRQAVRGSMLTLL